MTDAAQPTAAPGVSALKPGRYRWVICALLFSATAINYIDRQTISLLKGPLTEEFGWTELTYGDIVFWFQAAYATGYFLFGALIDRIGARIGYALAVVIWTLGHMGHGLVSSIAGFTAMRWGLGLGEAGNFPAGIKAVTEWFPKRERALAIGIFNAGSNVGAIVAPLLVPAVTLMWGWRAAFFATGAIGIVWLIAWLALYRRPQEHKRVGAAELAFIEQDPADTGAKVGWFSLFKHRETWAYSLGKFLIDPIWWMWLFWLPDFLHKRHGLDLKTYGPPLVVLYLISDVGSIFGGWLSSSFLKSGRSLNFSRKAAMFVCSLLVLPVAFAAYVDNLWGAVAIIGVAMAAHQGFSANLYALPSDVFPRKATASVVGIGGTIGAIGGMVMAKYVSKILEQLHVYTPIFIIAAASYLVALLAVHVFTPKYEPAKVG